MPATHIVIPTRIVIPAKAGIQPRKKQGPTPSFPRKRESRNTVQDFIPMRWIPACAGMTMWGVDPDF